MTTDETLKHAMSNADIQYMATNPEMDRLVAIIETQNDIAATRLDADAVMDVVAGRVCELTNATGASIQILEGTELVYSAAAGSLSEHDGLRVDASRCLAGLCLRTGETVRCDDAEADDRIDPLLNQLLGARSMLCVPLVREQRVAGVMTAVAPTAGAFDLADAQTLRLLSGLVAATLTQAARFTEEEQASRHDPLTELGNRIAYEERLATEVARASRYGHALSLAVLDLDGFKLVNERYGYHEGDTVLRKVASLVRQARTADDCFRIGGDEFAVLMPNTDREGAELAARRLRNLVAAAALCDGLVSVVFGVAQAVGEDAMAFHTEAYDALYEAKLSRKSAEISETEQAS